jgi:tetratricopeptide (TPR) repeat protein
MIAAAIDASNERRVVSPFVRAVFPTVALIILVLSPCAHAEDRQLAREHFQRGSKAFALGAYDEAIAEYSAAYRIKDDPALLYNIAQAHRLASHAPEALRFYKMYLSLVPKAPNRDEIESKIAELQKLAEQQKKTATEMPPDTIKQPSEPPRQEPAPEPRGEPVVTPRPRPQRPIVAFDGNAGRSKKIAGLASAGVGVAALITGIALGAVAKGLEGEVIARYDPGKAADGATFGVAGPVLIGVGGAAVLAGVVVAVLGFKESRASKVSVIPAIGERSFAATVQLGF